MASVWQEIKSEPWLVQQSEALREREEWKDREEGGRGRGNELERRAG